MIVFVLGLGGLLYREMTFASPVVNFRVLRERNFAASCVIIFSAFAVLYAATVALPALLQTLFGYDAFVSGLVLSPAGFFSIMMLVVVGALLGRGLDARWLIATGLIVMAAGAYWMALMNLQISPWQVVWPRVVMIVGLSLIFAPINVAAFLYTPKRLRGAAVGLLALLRNEGGSFGTSMGQTIQERREQFHLSRLGDSLSPLNPHVHSFLERGQAFFMQHTGDPAGSQQMTVQALADLRQQQAASLAYFDVFWLCAAAGRGARPAGAADETLRGREGDPRRGGIARRSRRRQVLAYGKASSRCVAGPCGRALDRLAIRYLDECQPALGDRSPAGYTTELFEVRLHSGAARAKVDADADNRWLSEPEITAGQCTDGKPISATMKLLLSRINSPR